MSLYEVNKFMRMVIIDSANLAAYVEDPAGFTAQRYEGTDEGERRALETRDYGALYTMGAHPYLLWSFSEAVWVPEVTRPELVESYRVAARAAGFPDWSTTPRPGAAVL